MPGKHVPIINRLPKARKLLGAEIGVWRGFNAARLLTARRGLTLLCVDRWAPYPSDVPDDAPGKTGNRNWEQIYAGTAKRLERFGERAKILRMSSLEAAEQVENGSLYFAFIDAAHSSPSVDNDIEAWEKKIDWDGGGFLCGHDYGHKFPDVTRAVNRAAVKYGWVLSMGPNWTWFARRLPGGP